MASDLGWERVLRCVSRQFHKVSGQDLLGLLQVAYKADIREVIQSSQTRTKELRNALGQPRLLFLLIAPRHANTTSLALALQP